MTARLGIVLVPLLTLGSALAVNAEGDSRADVCLEVASGVLAADAWAHLNARVSDTVAEHTALFPDPTITAAAPEASPGAAIPSLRLDIDAGGPRGGTDEPDAGCLEPGLEWSARFGRDFLSAGADQMLAEAPTTPGIESSVDLEWYPDENRILTRLVFAGPLDIPNGTCWIDDALSVDGATGTVVASGEQGLKTSPFAEGACGRFFDHLAEGGAGAQAVTLLPTTIELEDGRVLRFVADQVTVATDVIIVGGRVEEG